MTYNPREYWTNQPAMAVQRAHAGQEIALLDVLERLSQPATILEIGVGAGRIGRLLIDKWPSASYVGIDIAPQRLTEARKVIPWPAQLFEADMLEFETTQRFDLVIAVEVLMHVQPGDLGYALTRMRTWSRRHVVTVDWTEPVDGPIAPWNFLHDYAAQGLEVIGRTGRQSIHYTGGWPA